MSTFFSAASLSSLAFFAGLAACRLQKNKSHKLNDCQRSPLGVKFFSTVTDHQASSQEGKALLGRLAPLRGTAEAYPNTSSWKAAKSSQFCRLLGCSNVLLLNWIVCSRKRSTSDKASAPPAALFVPSELKWLSLFQASSRHRTNYHQRMQFTTYYVPQNQERKAMSQQRSYVVNLRYRAAP